MARAKSMVYVLATTDFKFVKIGSTISPKMRFNNIQTACPYELFLWNGVRTLRIKEIESELHEQFSEWRFRGEWFCLPGKQLDLLSNRIAELNEMERRGCTTTSET